MLTDMFNALASAKTDREREKCLQAFEKIGMDRITVATVLAELNSNPNSSAVP